MGLRHSYIIPLNAKDRRVYLRSIAFNAYLEALIPIDVSFGLTALASGPIRPAMNALSKIFGSVIPLIYRAATAAPAARRYEPNADCNVLISMFLL
jgi:hypothetical protein